jgi:hypothetical protein
VLWAEQVTRLNLAPPIDWLDLLFRPSPPQLRLSPTNEPTGSNVNTISEPSQKTTLCHLGPALGRANLNCLAAKGTPAVSRMVCTEYGTNSTWAYMFLLWRRAHFRVSTFRSDGRKCPTFSQLPAWRSVVVRGCMPRVTWFSARNYLIRQPSIDRLSTKPWYFLIFFYHGSDSLYSCSWLRNGC